ncbi:4-alpha-glucanotransferase [Methylococcus sp. EFPC2]|nr:4-alpha-glucanotransferase [Methylococcus sp. EFPC2]
MLDQRRAGVLLHITSLPGGIGNGDLGHDAHAFVDLLADAGVTVWQTLPVGPTHEDGSPYQCMSAHAGSPLLINLEWLVDRGWLPELSGPAEDETPESYRYARLHEAFKGFKRHVEDPYWPAYGEFIREHAGWLEDFSLYTALREEFAHQSWQQWPAPLRDRQSAALEAARVRLAESIARSKFEQFVFFTQWKELRDHARGRGVILFGDMPIFVASDSADVWARKEDFDLDENGHARVVAGVPPDYFSATGQRWGNPHYNWARMQADGFSWWTERMHSQLELYDWVRIDHFRGFEAYWEIAADQETAMHGRWVKAPGKELLKSLFRAFPGKGLPLVAENLGIITHEVEALRNRFAIPGMLILQFAFDGGPGNPYLPHNHAENNVVYTGTHDNDTTLSWYEGLSPDQQRYVYEYLGRPEIRMPLALMQAALASVARLALLPMQDVLELGREHRMNTPGTVGNGNWRWRFHWEQVTDDKISRLRQMIGMYGRG